MKLSSLNEFKGKEVIIEWKDIRSEKGEGIDALKGIVEEIEEDGLTINYSEEEGKKALRKISIKDLMYIEEV